MIGLKGPGFQMKKFIPKKVDVLIVGSGPAGLSAGIRLARAGAEVIIADCRKKIGSPIRCAGIAPPDFFQQFGIEPRKEWICWYVKAADCLIVNREKFEFETAELLSKNGVVVLPQTTVIDVGEFDGRQRIVTLKNGRSIYKTAAKCVVAADGVASGAARRAGIDSRLRPNEIASCIARQVVDARVERTDTFFGARLYGNYPCPPYYFWVIPRGENLLSAGLALPSINGSKAERLLDRMIRETTAYSGGRIIQTVVGMVPFPKLLKPPYTDGLIVAGTAARLVNPINGGGLQFAAQSGAMAAETIIRLSGKPAVKQNLAVYENMLLPIKQKLEKFVQMMGPEIAEIIND